MAKKTRIEELQDEVDQENAAEAAAPGTPSIVVTAQTLAEAIVKAGEDATGQRRKIPYGKQQIRSPFNPTGNRRRKLNRPVYQTGIRVFVNTLTDEEIALLNSGKILPGRYIDKLVTVRVGDDGNGESALFIDYKNRTADQRMELGSRLHIDPKNGPKTGFESMLQMIVSEIEDQKTAAKARRKQEVEEALAG